MSNTSKHHRLSVATRNVQVITQVNNGATSAELAEEYHVTWETIRDSIRDKHYQVVKNPRNERPGIPCKGKSQQRCCRQQ